MCVSSNHSTVIAPFSQSVPVLWHSLTIPDCYVASSPRETSAFRFRKVACWVQTQTHSAAQPREHRARSLNCVCVCVCVCLGFHGTPWSVSECVKTQRHTQVIQRPLLPPLVLHLLLVLILIWHVKHLSCLPQIEGTMIASTWCQCDSLFVVPNPLVKSLVFADLFFKLSL